MNTENLKKQLLELKKQIDGLEISIPGSIQITYLRCGKKNCRCHQTEDQRLWHGPYYLWYRRVGGKTTTQSIAEEDVQSYRIWIRNREKLEALVQKIITLGADYATAFKSAPDKFKKRLSTKRGK
jgi:hypothetical protein